MGIQINGNNTTISDDNGQLNVTGANINLSGIITSTQIKVGSAVTVNTTGFQVGSSSLHSLGVALSTLNVTGVSTHVGVSTFSSVGIGTTNATSTLQVIGGDARFSGVIETVSAATTYVSGSTLVLEMDVRQATVYTYTMPAGANIGIVSIKNMPAESNRPSGTTVTCIFTQPSSITAGTGNTTAATGIGTNCTVVGYAGGTSVTGISTRGLVGSATTVTLSSTGSDADFVSFFVNYNGSTNTSATSYKVYVTKNGGFRQGTIGV
jgi:hypothetical protein